MNIFIGTLGMQKQKLGDDRIGHLVVHSRTEKDDAVLQQPAIDIIAVLRGRFFL